MMNSEDMLGDDGDVHGLLQSFVDGSADVGHRRLASAIVTTLTAKIDRDTFSSFAVRHFEESSLM